MLIKPVVSLKRLYTNNKEEKNEYWNNMLFSSKTAATIRLIAEAVINHKGEKVCNIWLPDYYCVETESALITEGIIINHYPINNRLEPDWNWIKEELGSNIDIFVFVHYFGECLDANRARVFCNNKKVLLIEDCAHVLFDYGKIGKNGDFVLYSPYKILGLLDGALVKCACKEEYRFIEEYLTDKLSGTSSNNKDIAIWRIKKSLQKLLRINKKISYTCDEHYADATSLNVNYSISKKSLNILKSYTDEELREIAFLRRENLKMIDFIVTSICCDIEKYVSLNNECPLFAVYSLENVKDKAAVVKAIIDAGLTVFYWPTLNEVVKDLPQSSVARSLSKNLIFISVSQSIGLQELAKLFKKNVQISQCDMTIKKVENSIDRADWDNVVEETPLANITQDWKYGDAKTVSQNWRIDRFISYKNEKPIGVVQVLKKSFMGIDLITRINMGPLLIEEECNIDNELSMVETIKNKFYRFTPMVYAPRTFMNPEAMIKLLSYDWKTLSIHGFPSGYINIPDELDCFRSAINSKWRNQLKLAEKSGYTLSKDVVDINTIIEIYKEEQAEKNYKGVDQNLLLAIANMDDSPFRIFHVKNAEGRMIAFDIFYRHGKSATYYVGWNDQEGRKYCMNNYLLYHGALELKKEGVTKLDLGGIDTIKTESIAKFKLGMNPKAYRHMGEYFKF